MKKNVLIILLLIIGVLPAGFTYSATESPTYKISTIAGREYFEEVTANNYPVQPNGLAIYDNHLFIANEDQDVIQKVNLSTGKMVIVAGNGIEGYNQDNILATSAQLNDPTDIAVDSDGNMFIADMRNHRIRKVDTNGIISTVAGTGVTGYIGTTRAAIASPLNSPNGIAVDNEGNLFIADTQNESIRKVDTNGTISTLIQSSEHILGIGLDQEGNVYYNNWIKVMKINEDGSIETIAEKGGTIDLGFSYLKAFEVDKLGNIYVVDDSQIIRKIDTEGNIYRIGNSHTFNGVLGLTVDASGNVYISHDKEHLVKKIDSSDQLSIVAGNGTRGFYDVDHLAIHAHLYKPSKVAVDPNGNVYFCDCYNYSIRKIGSDGLITTIAGTGIAGSSGDGGPATFAQLSYPKSVTIDDVGQIYTIDRDKIRKITTDGNIQTIPLTVSLRGMAIDDNDNLYGFSSYYVYKIHPDGSVSTIAGNGNMGYSSLTGPAISAPLNMPNAVALDSSGNLYIANSNSHVIQKVDVNGIISTVAGTGDSGYSGDNGLATQAKLHGPQDIVLDKNGNLYIADSYNNCIRMVDTNGFIYTIAGTGDAGYSGDDGLATLAKMYRPIGIDVDEEGNLYISDSKTHRIRKIEPAYTVSFDTFGGNTINPIFIPKDKKITNVITPVKSGYTFNGWYKENTFENHWDFNNNIVSDNMTLYAKWKKKHTNSSNDNDTSLLPEKISIKINGKDQQILGIAKTTIKNGLKITTIQLDPQKLKEKINQEGKNTKVTLPINNNGTVMAKLNGQMVKDMELKDDILEIMTKNVTYTLPVSQIMIDAVSKQLGKQVTLKDIEVEVEIGETSKEMAKVVENTQKRNTFALMLGPIDFRVSCSYKNKSIDVSKFNTYVERTIAIPSGVDPEKITTGIIVYADGTTCHVPTQVYIRDNKYYAKINSLTNSTYSVIWYPIEFKDVTHHWAKDSVNDMGSRMVISGVGNGMFEPDRDITRAEFAAIMVTSLGLKPGTGNNPFTDVKSTDWYCEYIETAYEYGIIAGYDKVQFGPNDNITREQAMTMIARAMKITQLNLDFKANEIDEILAKFADWQQAATWAKYGIADCVDAGIVLGKGAQTLVPKDEITRAEVAAIVRRLLQKSDLI